MSCTVSDVYDLKEVLISFFHNVYFHLVFDKTIFEHMQLILKMNCFRKYILLPYINCLAKVSIDQY